MFLDVSTDSVIRGYWTAFWNLYGSTILSLTTKLFRDESVRDRSCRIYKVEQFYLAFELCYLIKIELNRRVNLDEDYYEAKYSIADKKQKLACHGISLTDMFNIFSITFTTSPDLTVPTPVYIEGESCTCIFTCETTVEGQETGCNHCTS